MLVLAAQSTAVPQLLAWLSLEKHPVSRCCMLRRLLPKYDATETSQCIITFPVALAGHKLVLTITVKASSVHEQTPKLHLFFF